MGHLEELGDDLDRADHSPHARYRHEGPRWCLLADLRSLNDSCCATTVGRVVVVTCSGGCGRPALLLGVGWDLPVSEVLLARRGRRRGLRVAAEARAAAALRDRNLAIGNVGLSARGC